MEQFVCHLGKDINRKFISAHKLYIHCAKSQLGTNTGLSVLLKLLFVTCRPFLYIFCTMQTNMPLLMITGLLISERHAKPKLFPCIFFAILHNTTELCSTANQKMWKFMKQLVFQQNIGLIYFWPLEENMLIVGAHGYQLIFWI